MSQTTPPLHAEVRAVIIELIKARQMKVNVEPTADAILQAVADALLSKLPKERKSEVKTSKAFQDTYKITSIPDENARGFNECLDAVTRVIGELQGR